MDLPSEQDSDTWATNNPSPLSFEVIDALASTFVTTGIFRSLTEITSSAFSRRSLQLIRENETERLLGGDRLFPSLFYLSIARSTALSGRR